MYDVTNKFESAIVRKMYQNFRIMENYNDKKDKKEQGVTVTIVMPELND